MNVVFHAKLCFNLINHASIFLCRHQQILFKWLKYVQIEMFEKLFFYWVYGLLAATWISPPFNGQSSHCHRETFLIASWISCQFALSCFTWPARCWGFIFLGSTSGFCSLCLFLVSSIHEHSSNCRNDCTDEPKKPSLGEIFAEGCKKRGCCDGEADSHWNAKT